LRLKDSGEEEHEAGAAKELGDEDDGMALSLGAVDPLQGAGRICAGRSAQREEWSVWSALSM
jgi:hypothetical protein